MPNPKEHHADLAIYAEMFNEPEYNAMVTWKVTEVLREIRRDYIAIDATDEETGRTIPAVRITFTIYGEKRKG